jgi:hypothetical protein
MDRVAEVAAFRDRLVAYMDVVLDNRPYGSIPLSDVDADVLVRLREEQTSLGQTYGRLYTAINRWGVGTMGTPASGTLSHDIIQDAIHNITSTRYSDISAFARQHLDTVIGRMQGEAEENVERRQVEPETIYRLTSPLYWLGRLWALIRWLWGSWSRRVATVIAAVILAVISGVASGWAQAIFAQP